MTEYEVLKRHDVYVVRKVGGGYYGTMWCDSDGILRGSYTTSDAPSRNAKEFSWRWIAVLTAKALERESAKRRRRVELYDARKSATEERVWR